MQRQRGSDLLQVASRYPTFPILLEATRECLRDVFDVPALKEGSGKLRVQIYGDNPADFLAKGQWLKRVELAVTGSGPMNVCVALPSAGKFAVAVRHDLDGNGKSGWEDGGGFSRNPGLSLFKLKPAYKDVAVTVGNGVKPLDVYINYRHGLAIKPLRP